MKAYQNNVNRCVIIEHDIVQFFDLDYILAFPKHRQESLAISQLMSK